MFQIVSQGVESKVAIKEGLQTTRKDIPLGSYIDDGIRRFRWVHVKATTFKVNQVLQKSDAGPLVLCTNALTSATDGYGDSAGDTYIKLYSAVGLDSTYKDGFLMIYTGKGKGQLYPIDFFETGGSGKATKLKIFGELNAALSATDKVKILPNPYRNWELANSATYTTTSNLPAGAATTSGSTSGYIFVQTRGLGIGWAKGTVKQGNLLGVQAGLSGKLSTITNVGRIVAEALESATASDRFAVNWLFE